MKVTRSRMEGQLLVHVMTAHVTLASCPSLSRYTMDPLAGYRTYVQLRDIRVGSLTSDRCVSPATEGAPFHVDSELLLMHKPAASHRHRQTAHYPHISATQWEPGEKRNPVHRLQSPARYHCATETGFKHVYMYKR